MLSRPLIVIGVSVMLFIASLGLLRSLGSELIPELIQGEFFADIELPPGARLEVTDRRLVELTNVAETIDSARTVYTIAGTSNEQGGTAGELREYLGQITCDSRSTHFAGDRGCRHDEDPCSDRSRQPHPCRGAAPTASERPAIVSRFGRPSYFSFKTAIEVEIRGFNIELLKRLAEEAVARFETIDGLADVSSSTEGGHPELQVHLNRDRLASYGLGVSDVASVLRSMVQGEIATDITRSDRTIDIRIRAAEQFRGSATALENLTVTHAGDHSDSVVGRC